MRDTPLPGEDGPATTGDQGDERSPNEQECRRPDDPSNGEDRTGETANEGDLQEPRRCASRQRPAEPAKMTLAARQRTGILLRLKEASPLSVGREKP